MKKDDRIFKLELITSGLEKGHISLDVNLPVEEIPVILGEVGATILFDMLKGRKEHNDQIIMDDMAYDIALFTLVVQISLFSHVGEKLKLLLSEDEREHFIMEISKQFEEVRRDATAAWELLHQNQPPIQ